MNVIRYVYIDTPVKNNIAQYGLTKNIRSVQLESIIGKQNFYNIRSGETNILSWVENVTPLSTTIPEGNYTITSLAVAVKSVMETASTAGGAGLTYTVAYSLINFTCSISVSATTLTIRPNAVNPCCFYMLGFHVNGTAGASNIADSVYNVLADYLEIRLTGINIPYYVNGVVQNFNSWEIPITGLAGSMIYFLNISDTCLKIFDPDRNEININGVEIAIYDNFGYLIDNHGSPISIIIRVSTSQDHKPQTDHRLNKMPKISASRKK